MTRETFVAAAILVLIIGGAVLYICKAKKSGVKCIGCPDGAACSGHCSGCSGNCGCGSNAQSTHREAQQPENN